MGIELRRNEEIGLGNFTLFDKGLILSLFNHRMPWGEFLAVKKRELDNNNPHISRYLLGEKGVPKEPGYARDFRVGVILAYEAFKKIAGDIQLPVLSEEFIEDYHCISWCRFDGRYGQDQKTRNLGEDAENNIRKGLFILLEPQAYKALRARFDNHLKEEDPEQMLFDHPIFDGFVSAYFMLREGFTDPKNRVRLN